jgi:hypothetical protein
VIKESPAKKNADPRTLIAAFTGRGDLDMNDGKPKEALLNYLQGAIVLNRGEKSPEHEVALARSSMTCAKLAAAEKTREAKDLHRGRAQELLPRAGVPLPPDGLQVPDRQAPAGNPVVKT